MFRIKGVLPSNLKDSELHLRIYAEIQKRASLFTVFIGAVLFYVFERQLTVVHDPLPSVLSLGVYILALAIFGRPQFGAYLIVLVLMMFSMFPFFRPVPVVVGPLNLPTPLMGVTLLTVGVGAVRLLLTRRFQRLRWEPSWMAPLLLILVVKVAFAWNGYGGDVEVERLTFMLEGLSTLAVVILVLHRPEQLRLLLRCLAIGYLFYSCANSYPAWVSSIQGYRGLEGSELFVSAATTAAAMINLFLPVGLGMFIGEPTRSWRWTMLVSLLGCVAFSTVTASRGGFVGMGFSLLAWLFLGLRYPRQRLFVGVGAVVAMILLVNSTYPFYVSDPGFSGEVSIGEFVSHNTRKMLAEPDTGRLRTYAEAAKNIAKAPLTGVGAGKPSHSLFLGAGQEGGILMMALWTTLFAILVVRSYRMWLSFRCHPYWGPVTLGLSISMAYAFIQNWLDGMLYAVGYGLVFWLLRGVESVLSAEKAQVNFPVALSIQKNEETPA